MVMAKIDRPMPKIPTKPLPKPPEGPTDCFPTKPEPPKIDLDKLKDNLAFSVKDQNDDGSLDKAEFDAGRNKLEAKLDPNKFDRYDGNKDGKIDREEYHAGKEKERFKESIRGKLDLPKWDAKKDWDLGDQVKHVGEKVTDIAKEAIDDIF